jgi:hypothetical protein
LYNYTAGWLWGSVWFVYCTVATYWTGLIIGRVFNANPTLTTYPNMAAEAFAQLSTKRSGGRVVTPLPLPGVRMIIHGPYRLSSIEPCFDCKITW